MLQSSRWGVFAAFVFSPAPLVAQSAAGIEVIPHVGVYAPLRDFGPAAPATGPWFLQLEQMEPAVSLGASLQVNWPSTRLGTRITGLATLESTASGVFNCYPGLACPSVLLPSEADISVFAALGDLLFSPLGTQGGVSPYVILGAGAKHNRFSWPDAAVLVEAGSYHTTLFGLHGGLGVTIPLGRSALRAEISDLWSPWGDRIAPENALSGARSTRGRPLHDLSVILGWSLLRF